MIGIDRLDRGRGLFEAPARRRVAGQRVEHRVLQVEGVGDQVRRDLGERRHHEARLHREVGEVAGERAQLIDHGVRLERAVRVAERDEGLGIEHEPELPLEGHGERRD